MMSPENDNAGDVNATMIDTMIGIRIERTVFSTLDEGAQFTEGPRPSS
jgi:hypothetical protein